MRYAEALAEYADAGGYDLEVTWDTCTVASMGMPYDRAQHRSLVHAVRAASRSGWSWSTCCAAPTRCCCSTSPTTTSTCPARSGSSSGIRESPKTILFISHDRELLANTATRIVTVELGAAGNLVWTHPGGFASYHEAREDRFLRFEELRRRWDEEHAKIKALVLRLKIKSEYNDGMSSQYRAAQTRLRKFEEAGPPTEQPREQQVSMRLKGGRTGKRAVVCTDLELDRPDAALRPRGLVRRAGRGPGLQRLRQVALPAAAGRRRQRPRRRAPPGRRAAGPGAAHRQGQARRPGATRAGSCRPTTTPSCAGGPCWTSCTAATACRPARAARAWAASRRRGCSTATSSRTPASRPSSRSPAASRRASRSCCSSCSGATLLLLDEPTDNLDVQSAEALEAGLDGLRRHGAGGDPRPVVRPRLRPVPGLRRRRRGLRVRRPGVGRGTGGAGPMSTPPAGLEILDLDPFDDPAFRAWHAVYLRAQARAGRGGHPVAARGAARPDAAPGVGRVVGRLVRRGGRRDGRGGLHPHAAARQPRARRARRPRRSRPAAAGDRLRPPRARRARGTSSRPHGGDRPGRVGLGRRVLR